MNTIQSLSDKERAVCHEIAEHQDKAATTYQQWLDLRGNKPGARRTKEEHDAQRRWHEGYAKGMARAAGLMWGWDKQRDIGLVADAMTATKIKNRKKKIAEKLARSAATAS